MTTTTAPERTATPPPVPVVEFSLLMDVPSYEICCGILPREVMIRGNPVLKNKGNTKAHHVIIVFELFNAEGENVLINGDRDLERDIGDLGPGEERSEGVEFTIGLVDGYKIQDTGATALFHIYSDERNVTLKEEFAVPSK